SASGDTSSTRRSWRSAHSLGGIPPGNLPAALRTMSAVLLAPISSSAEMISAVLSLAELKKNWSNPTLLTSARNDPTSCPISVSAPGTPLEKLDISTSALTTRLHNSLPASHTVYSPLSRRHFISLPPLNLKPNAL